MSFYLCNKLRLEPPENCYTPVNLLPLFSLPLFSMSGLAKPLAWLLGVVLTVVGVLGFVLPSPLLGLFAVDPVHNVVHLLSGVIGLAAASKGESMAKLFLIVFGLIYLVVTAWGFFVNENVLGIFVVNSADNYLHLAIGAVCVIVGFGSKKA